MSEYKFEWDKEKAKANKSKHNITFEEAETVFEDENGLYLYDEIHATDEERFMLIGLDTYLRELTVVYCYRNGEGIIRIISARKATKKEIDLYWRRFE
ncbi:MAG: BrnT family toxin [Defluviitaleaceae bacterium]|nr:BrnT family toxin [Defluviitaleaceae bacterium]